ncbi:MAG: hypothetical protein ACI9W2_002802 [Gammaproteobacteria bacterium]|jgi:hypothetical protein
MQNNELTETPRLRLRSRWRVGVVIRRLRSLCLPAIVVMAFAAPAAVAKSGDAGVVVFAKGVTTAQVNAGKVRFLGRGAPLYEGDIITTASKSFAILKLADDTRITLRPQTVFAVEAFSVGSGGSGDGSKQGASAGVASGARAVLRLFRGGLRAVTGFISKRDPEAFKLRTRVATIGIRGTQFEARICAQDCTDEAQRRRNVDATSTTPVAGRIVLLRGKLQGTGEFANPRSLGLGGAVYEGDVISTDGRSYAVIQYRDGTRTSIGRDTQLRIDAQRYFPTRPAASKSFFSLLRGGLRIITGLVGKHNREAFAVRTAVATIGIRGTGFDVVCTGDCPTTTEKLALGAPTGSPPSAQCVAKDAASSAGDGLAASVWDGEVGVSVKDCTATVGKGQHLLLANGTPRRLKDASPLISALEVPRPDSPDAVDPLIGDPFAAVAHDSPEPGLYVSVFEGDVTMTNSEGGRVDLGSDETGFAGGGDGPVGVVSLVRVVTRPNFSPTPDPRVFDNPDIGDIFQLFDDPGDRNQNRFECVL